MGIKQDEIKATEVLIRTPTKTLIVRNPTVAKINMMGQESLQVSGTIEEIEEAPAISDEDIDAVIQQANCSRKEAEHALKETGGDIAAAILRLQS